jgi:ubiquinone/menaquinone biosynthesis C-methylase UbiE
VKNKTTGRIADSYRPNSLAFLLRKRRHQFLLSLLEQVPGHIRVLDVGGTQEYWDGMGISSSLDIQITLMNLTLERTNASNMQSLVGDATNMEKFRNNEFDVVFSNSVIEHVGNYQAQQRMANEVRRVGKRFFVQTPNYWFPVEPHFLIIGFQWLPRFAQLFLIRNFNLGWFKQTKNVQDAINLLEHNRLLKINNLLELFPGANLYREKVFLITKSFIVYQGW